MDKVIIKDLLVRGIIGINQWEREKIQDIVINVAIHTDMTKAGESDDIHDCLNYRTIAKEIIDHTENAHRRTVEALATDIAKICLSYDGATRALVRVEKPGALRFSQSVGVEIERERSDFEE